MRARRCRIERWDAEEIDGDAAEFGLKGSPTRVVRVSTPPPRGTCVKWEGDAQTTAARLAEALRQEGFA